MALGLLVDGVWQSQSYDTEKNAGQFIRSESQFRHFITADGSSGFKAESNRYHLYISLACPWACRTFIMRKLKKLERVIGISIVDPILGAEGWEFSERPGCIPDTVNGFKYLHQLYTATNPNYTGRVTVPVLWDKQAKMIVNNESAEIMRMLNSEFNRYDSGSQDFYPLALQSQIDMINQRVYEYVNNGVYKCGFATKQAAYEAAFDNLFGELAGLDRLLAKQRYLVGNQITEADWRLFTTLVRFDAVYYSHFKCNLRRIIDYHHLHNYLKELYQYPGIAETVNFEHIKQHYYKSHLHINPTAIIPKGPLLDLEQPHDRGKLK